MHRILAGALVALVTPSCASQQSVDALQAQVTAMRGVLDEVRAEQTRLLERCSTPAAATAAPEGDGADAPTAPEPPPTERAYVPLGDSPSDGPAGALVTLVEFSDFQCPYCGRVQETLRELRQRYGADLRFVFKHNPLPFHDRALPAALASECARERDKFWAYERLLFASQRALDDESLLDFAAEVGLDRRSFSTCLTKAKHQSRIDQDVALAESVGADGTPTFFVNGRVIVGAQPIERFVELIDEELAAAKASGVPAERYYESLMPGR